MIGIYKITSPTGKIYIGQSVNIERRWKEHKKGFEKLPLYNSIRKYGVENHIFEILEECEIEQLNERERHYQDFYDVLGPNGLNLKLTETNDKSGYISELTRTKLRGIDRKKFFTEEVKERAKIKRNNTLSNRTEEEKLFYKNISSKAQKKYLSTLTDEQKRLKNLNTSKSMKGLVSSSPGKSKKVINTETGEIFDSIKLAAESIGIKYQSLCFKLGESLKNNTNLKYYTNV